MILNFTYDKVRCNGVNESTCVIMRMILMHYSPSIKTNLKCSRKSHMKMRGCQSTCRPHLTVTVIGVVE